MAVGMLVLGGCSTDLPPVLVRAEPVNAPGSFAEFSFKILPPGQVVRLEIDDQGPRYQFAGGMSSYEALSLPDLVQPYRLKIESEVVRDSWFENGKIYFPVLTFLDAGKHPIKSFDSLPYVTQKPWTRPNYISTTIEIAGELAAARYVVIHTAPERLKYAIGRDGGKDLMQSNGFDTMMYAPMTEPRYRYEFADQGWLTVKAYDPAAEAAKEPVQY